jgi:prolyl-tRNA synthetase
MRFSRLFGRTLREAPSDADVPSHRLLVRAGMIDQVATGVYTLLPLGLRVQRKLEAIIRQELDRAGAQELLMPALQPLELWQRSGRDAALGAALFTLRDRRERPLALGPTHEEVITQLVAAHATSHRDLPVTLYQIQTKFRDEPRPRAGLLRVREFTMMDAYSFDRDEAGLDASYDAIYDAYRRIFARCGLPVVPVQADSGAIGGKESVEFVLLAETGEDTIVACTNTACGYAANTEKAQFRRTTPAYLSEAPRPIEEVATPGVKTIDELAAFLDVPPAQTLKAVFYTATFDAKSEIVFAAVRGDIAVNEVKLQNLLGATDLRLANDQEIVAAGLVAGSASPVGIVGLRTVVDTSVPGATNLVAGGNRPDVHLRNVCYGRDFTATHVADIGTAKAGDVCVCCGSPLEAARAIEVGHVFKLGTRYSQVFDARYLDAAGQQRIVWMGCYGIGVGRTLAAAVELGHDEKGIVWPAAIAPYHVHLIALNVDTASVAEAAGGLYRGLLDQGIEVLFDDRAESAGIKFNDADLIGLPLRVTLGPRGLRDGQVEVRPRAGGPPATIPIQGAAGAIRQRVQELLAGGD